MNEQYLPTADAVILLYDVRNFQTLKDSKAFIDDVQKYSDNQGIVKILGVSVQYLHPVDSYFLCHV